MNRPRYIHDCTRCTFLGQHGTADLYFCPQIEGLPTVIARYSSNGADYQSGMFNPHTPALQEAKTRAMARGLLKSKPVTLPVPLAPQPLAGRFQGFLLRLTRLIHLSVW